MTKQSPPYGSTPFNCYYGSKHNHKKRCLNQCVDCKRKEAQEKLNSWCNCFNFPHEVCEECKVLLFDDLKLLK